jgi:hypothetical protein
MRKYQPRGCSTHLHFKLIRCQPQSGQTKDYAIGISCFSAKYAELKRKSKDQLVWVRLYRTDIIVLTLMRKYQPRGCSTHLHFKLIRCHCSE